MGSNSWMGLACQWSSFRPSWVQPSPSVRLPSAQASPCRAGRRRSAVADGDANRWIVELLIVGHRIDAQVEVVGVVRLPPDVLADPGGAALVAADEGVGTAGGRQPEGQIHRGRRLAGTEIEGRRDGDALEGGDLEAEDPLGAVDAGELVDVGDVVGEGVVVDDAGVLALIAVQEQLLGVGAPVDHGLPVGRHGAAGAAGGRAAGARGAGPRAAGVRILL